jgi:two-component system, chemotaxis family, response regulator Rcp1
MNSQSEPVDLLLVDMHLPRGDGEEILKCLRSLDHFVRTPVLVITSSDAPRDHACAHGALHYFRKPSDFSAYMRLGIMMRALLSPILARSTEPANEGDAEGRE